MSWWKVVFANKSRKLGWIWIKLGRWGWGLKRLSLARFQRNCAMGFEESAKNGSQRRCFLSREPRTTSATFLRSISAKPPTNTCPGGGSRRVVSHSRKVSIKGSNFSKNSLFCVQNGTLFVTRLRITGNGSRETFCDAYSVSIPWWTSHRYAVPRWLLLRDVPFSSYPRPNVSLCHGIGNGQLGIRGCGDSSAHRAWIAPWREAEH